jgi:hypothetical protein
MNLKHLTDKTLLADTLILVRREKETSLEILHHLLEIERRKLFVELKCSSLFDYCVRVLGYSEGAAQRRISSARLMGKSEEVQKALVAGEVNLTQLSIMGSIKKEKPETLIKDLLKLAKESGSAKKFQEEIKKTKNKKVVVSIKVDLSSEEAEELDSLKRELNLSEKELLMELIRFKKKYLEKTKYHQTQRRMADKSHETKTIPAQVKRDVYERSQRKCEKCHSQYRLEIHHLKPRSHGGVHEINNLKLLCYHCHRRESFCQGFMVPIKPTKIEFSEFKSEVQSFVL